MSKVDDQTALIKPQSDLRRRLALGALVWFAMVCWTGGVVLSWPVLLFDLRRHNPWFLLGLLAGDVTSAFWFLQFAATHLFTPGSLVDRPADRRRLRLMAWAGASLIVGLIVDAIFTGIAEENANEKPAHVATVRAEVYEIESRPLLQATRHRCYYRFTDAAGDEYRGLFIISEDNLRGIRNILPAVKQAVEGRRLPFVVPVQYDPQRPWRSWPSPLIGEFMPIHVMASCGTDCLQLFLVPLFFLELSYSTRVGRIPWWGEFYKVFPFTVQAVFMLLAGLFTG